MLRYRVDPSSTLTSVAMNDAGTNGDSLATDGIYSGVIPGQVSGTIVAFRIEATDALGATNRFPTARVMYPGDTEQRECLVRFGEPVGAGSFGTYHLWMTAATFNAWANRSKAHNGALDITFAYDSSRAIYNAGAKFAGSLYSSSYEYNTPTGTNCGYSLEFPGDERFLGATALSLDFAKFDKTFQLEQVFHSIARDMGLSFLNRRYVHLYVNGVGAKDRIYPTGAKVYEDTQQPDGDFLDQWFSADSDGDLYKLEVLWKAYSFPMPIPAPVYTNATLILKLRSGTLDIPHYRWTWLKRAVQGSASDYTSLSNLMSAVQDPSASNYISAVNTLMDTEQWIRVIALRRIAADGDAYGVREGHNMYAYKPAAEHWRLQTVDVEFPFTASTVGTNAGLVNDWTCDQKVIDLLSKPVFERAFWRAVQDAASTPTLAANLDAILDGNYEALTAHGVTNAASPDDSINIQDEDYTHRSWLSGRRTFIINEVAKLAAPFVITNGFSTTQSNIILGGKAPVEIRFIRLDNRTTNEPVSWPTVTNWSLPFVLTNGPNTVTAKGYDRMTNFIYGATNTVTITNSP